MNVHEGPSGVAAGKPRRPVASDWDGLAIEETGNGPGVLWIHGYTMRTRVWHPVWNQIDGWRHLGIDLPWHGRSRALGEGEDAATLADTLVAAALAHGVRHVVALSLGTVVAVEMAVRHPTAFASWTLVAPALAGMPHEPLVRRRYADLARLYAERGAGPHMTTLWMRRPPNIFAGMAARPRRYARLAKLIDQHRWVELADGGMRRLTDRPQPAARLSGVPVPILLLVGDEDLLTHRACARSIAAAAPGASLRTLPGTGHLPVLEEPAAAASLILRHLRQAGPTRHAGRRPPDRPLRR